MSKTYRKLTKQDKKAIKNSRKQRFNKSIEEEKNETRITSRFSEQDKKMGRSFHGNC